MRISVIRSQVEVFAPVPQSDSTAVVVGIGNAVVEVEKSGSQGFQTGGICEAGEKWAQAQRPKRRSSLAGTETAVWIDPSLNVRGISWLAGADWARDVDVVTADQMVRAHEQISDIDTESPSKAAVNFQTCLFGNWVRSVVAVHSSGAIAASGWARTCKELR